MRQVTVFLLFFSALSSARTMAQGPTWQWARSASGHDTELLNTVAIDPFGNVIVAGYFGSDTMNIGTITLHNNTPGFDDMLIAKYDANGNLLWARAFGGSFDDKVTALATDASGNIYMTGYFYSPTIVVGTDTLTNAGNVGDILVVKYDPSGNVLWSRRDGGPALEIPYAIGVDDANNVIVAGRFSSNSIAFGTTTLLQAGSMDVFVVKYGPTGQVLWAQGAGGGSNDEAYALAVAPGGDVVVAGYYTQHALFGTTDLPNPGLANIFLARCDAATGTFQWARSVAGDGDERALTIALDASENIYIGGFFQSDSLTFGGATLHSTASDNGYIARFDAVGDPVWAQALNARSRVQGLVLANNALYACGTFRDDGFAYGPDVLTEDGGSDLFLLKSDLAGNAHWAANQTSGGESGESPNGLAADASGNLVLAGNFDSDDVTFGPAQLILSHGTDMFVLKTGDGEVGIQEANAVEPIILSPNPSSGAFHIEGLSGKCRIEITDALGNAIYTLDNALQQGRIGLELPALRPGLYLVHIIADGRPVVRKLVIQ